MGDYHYYVYYLYEFQGMNGVIKTLETQFHLSNLAEHTYTFFTINAVHQEIIGPQVFIAISTGNVHVLARIPKH